MSTSGPTFVTDLLLQLQLLPSPLLWLMLWPFQPAVASCWQERLGATQEEVSTLIRRFPLIFGYSTAEVNNHRPKPNAK